MKKRTLIQAAVMATAALALGSPAAAQDFPPKKPVTMVVPFVVPSVFHNAVEVVSLVVPEPQKKV